MNTENKKFIFDSNIPFKKFNEFKKYKLNNNNNINRDDRNNNYEKNSTLEEEEMDEYKKIKIKEKMKINEKEKLKENEKEKIKNKEEKKLIEDKKDNEKLKEEEMKRKEEIEKEKKIMSIFQPYEKENIFSDYYNQLNNLEMEITSKKRCQNFLDLIKQRKCSSSFKRPVLKMIKDKELCELYKKVIKKPMDLQTLSKNFTNNIYKDVFSFLSDFSLIVTNAQLFNLNDSPIYNLAEDMKMYARKYIKKLFSRHFDEGWQRKIFLIRVRIAACAQDEQQGRQDLS